MKRERTVMAEARCRTPFCKTGRKPSPGTRGCCRSCYEIAMERVRAGVITVAQLVAAGMFEPIYTKKEYFDNAAKFGA